MLMFLDEFKKEFKKIKDKKTREKIISQIKKISENPEVGKPLKHKLKNYRSLRATPHRVIYSIKDQDIYIHCFDHRKNIYDKEL